MKKIKHLILLFLAFLSPVLVKAANLSYFAVGYRYSQPLHNISSTWVTYNSNNNTIYNYNLPNSDSVEMEQFNFRITIGSGNQFKKGFNYVITFDWFNDDNGSLLSYFNSMNHELGCRVNNWDTTNQTGSSCFSSQSIAATPGSTSETIHLSISFTPSKDFFGLTLLNNFDGTNYTSYSSSGWEVINSSYSVVSDGTQDIINNQNQNTQNIINNQNTNTQNVINNQNQNTQNITNALNGVLNGANQNTDDIINNQNQNTQDIQNTINDNFQSCRPSINLFNISSWSDVTVNGSGSSVNVTDKIVIISNPNGVDTYTNTGVSSSGLIIPSSYRKYFIEVKPNTTYTISFFKETSLSGTSNDSSYYSLITSDFVSGGAISYGAFESGFKSKTFTTSSDTKYLAIRFGSRAQAGSVTYSKIQVQEGSSFTVYEPYGQICTNKIDETNNAINGVNDSINNSDIGNSANELGDFLTGFQDNDTTGLSGIVSLPLRVFNTILTSQCTEFTIPIYNDHTFTVPCLQSSLSAETKNSTYFKLYQTLITGVISYACVLSLYKMVKNLKNPNDDRVEVIDL